MYNERFRLHHRLLELPCTPWKPYIHYHPNHLPTMASSKSDNLFKPIGEIATQTDAQPEVEDDEAARAEQQPRFELEDGEEREVQQIESLCMECGEQGVTRMLLTMIPYFKEVIVMSFKCEHCGNRNTEIQSAGEIQRGWRVRARSIAPD